MSVSTDHPHGRARFNTAAFRRARETSGLSPTLLARIVGCSPSTIRRLERTGGDMRLDRFARLCDTLGVPAEELITIEEA
jgi:transcriptional regulator with XRE-family HTH domain